MNIQWFPGHMAKTKRLITENIKLVDIVIELLDARIPLSSRNPEIDQLVSNKPRLIVLNKSDIADPHVNTQWKNYFNGQGIKVIFADSIKGKGLKEVTSAARDAVKEKLEHEKSRGRVSRAVRVMIVGIPNVGKSTFINKLVGKSVAVTGDKPGVTRGKQWIRINNDLELLDTPGILWPKFEDPETGIKLASTGAVKDEIIDSVELASKLLEDLSELYPSKLMERYKLEKVEGSGIELLKVIGKKRGAVISGGEIDLNRAATIILDEFRSARIGNLSLERPSEPSVGSSKDNADSSLQ